MIAWLLAFVASLFQPSVGSVVEHARASSACAGAMASMAPEPQPDNAPTPKPTPTPSREVR
jgi:hypothetical protein